MLPSLNRLPLEGPKPRRPVPTSVYEVSYKEWSERTELVRGGCKPGNKEEMTCYNEWNARFFDRMQENPNANTIVLLSVGAGVLELRTIKTALDIRSETATPITKVWLIDKQQDVATGGQVALQYAAELVGVDVTYFTGDDCYNKASRALVNSPEVLVAAIGALNTDFGMIADHPSIVGPYRMMLNFVLQCAADARREAELYVVQAWHNAREGHVVKHERANDFVINQAEYLEKTLRLLRNMQGVRVS